jgi:hypothetical protein
MHRIAIIALVAGLALTAAPAVAVGISWEVVDNYGQAIMLNRNSHCTAAANVAKYHGLQREHETDDRLVTYAFMYVKQCACGERKNLPIHWFIGEGLTKLFETRAEVTPAVRVRATRSNKSRERVGWESYMQAISENRPVALTYCYSAASAAGVEAAKGRYEECFSVVGIGWMNYNGQRLLICHDGLRNDYRAGPAAGARLEPGDLGINTAGKPWGRPGTTLYKWNGGQKNLLLVFTDA